MLKFQAVNWIAASSRFPAFSPKTAPCATRFANLKMSYTPGGRGGGSKPESALLRAQAFLRGERPASSLRKSSGVAGSLATPTRYIPSKGPIQQTEDVSDSDSELQGFLEGLAKKKKDEGNPSASTLPPSSNALSNPPFTSSYLKRSTASTVAVAPTDASSSPPRRTPLISPEPRLAGPKVLAKVESLQNLRPIERARTTSATDLDSDSDVGSDFETFLRKAVKVKREVRPPLSEVVQFPAKVMQPAEHNASSQKSRDSGADDASKTSSTDGQEVSSDVADDPSEMEDARESIRREAPVPQAQSFTTPSLANPVHTPPIAPVPINPQRHPSTSPVPESLPVSEISENILSEAQSPSSEAAESDYGSSSFEDLDPPESLAMNEVSPLRTSLGDDTLGAIPQPSITSPIAVKTQEISDQSADERSAALEDLATQMKASRKATVEPQPSIPQTAPHDPPPKPEPSSQSHIPQVPPNFYGPWPYGAYPPPANGSAWPPQTSFPAWPPAPFPSSHCCCKGSHHTRSSHKHRTKRRSRRQAWEETDESSRTTRTSDSEQSVASSAASSTARRKNKNTDPSFRPFKVPIPKEPLPTEHPTLQALHALIKTHLSYIEHYVSANFKMTVADRQNLNTHEYTTLEDTRSFIKKHRKPPLTMEEALKLVEQEERALANP
ncbi:hypothetical protein DFS34DRAFT_258667 [Phlyctochytrium arcticum]|nr:hypothetical protein DFS34DRAFT_258667 [Phlyctochytrium arcticum]